MAGPLLEDFTSGGRSYRLVSLAAAERLGVAGLARCPRSVRLLAESVLHRSVTSGRVEAALPVVSAMVGAATGRGPAPEVEFEPGRLLLQDHSGIPVLADFASLRTVAAERGLDPEEVRPKLPVDVVVDHSVTVFESGPHALSGNLQREYLLNAERYRFLRWAEGSVPGVRVVPPSRGIIHQMHLEHLARMVVVGADGLVRPDTFLGTDSHTPMVNSLGILGWGVGGVEATSALLGWPVSVLSPRVVGVRVEGSMTPGVLATDVALALARTLRKVGVVGAFVEFHGPGLASLTVTDRATIANMAPEFGCTVTYFPQDASTLDYLRLTGRPESTIELVEAYARAQGLFSEHSAAAEPDFAEVVRFDLAEVSQFVAGPDKPHATLRLAEVPGSFLAVSDAAGDRVEHDGDGDIAIAAITSCTNTSNPRAMVIAGLLARNAVRRGLAVPSGVKSSLAPGSRVVTDYLERLDLLPWLEKLGFHVVGYGCTTCIGNSGDLLAPATRAVADGSRMVAVLSGNRNFPGRIHFDISASYLMSPPLVVAFALAGNVRTDLESEPVGHDQSGDPVMLADLWPGPDEVDEAVAAVGPDAFERERARLYDGDEQWAALDPPHGPLYDWPEGSTYLRRSPFVASVSENWLTDITGARVLVWAPDGTTTDHISPAGSIPPRSDAGQYLADFGVPASELNSYGCRRGNHDVLVRGTFDNRNFANRLAPGRTGAWTVLSRDASPVRLREAAEHYRSAGIPSIILAGSEYGTGSSRDWAAKGPRWLGVRAVLAAGFERIHRSNLIGMGILPLQFMAGDDADTLGLTGHELYDLVGLAVLRPRGTVEIRCRATPDDDAPLVFRMLARIDTTLELQLLRGGGILSAAVADLTPAQVTRTQG